MMPALDALFSRQHLAEDLQTTAFRRYMKSFADSLTGRTRARIGTSASISTAAASTAVSQDATGESMTADMVRKVAATHTYYVAPEMQVLVTAAAESMPDDEQPEPEDFPTQQGWLHIPGGITMLDVRGRSCVTMYVLWDCWGGAAHLTYLADTNHPLDWLRLSTPPEALAALPRITPWEYTELTFHQPLPQGFGLGVVLPPEVVSQVHIANGPDGQLVMIAPKGYGPDDLKPGIRVDPTARWVLACLRLMAQPLTSVTETGVPANVRRSMLRSKVKLRDTRVTVIDFRRRVGDHSEGSGREYSHRFLRRGHWRRQPFKNDAGEWDRRRIWIAPTVVGPADKPFIARDHVNAFTR